MQNMKLLLNDKLFILFIFYPLFMMILLLIIYFVLEKNHRSCVKVNLKNLITIYGITYYIGLIIVILCSVIAIINDKKYYYLIAIDYNSLICAGDKGVGILGNMLGYVKKVLSVVVIFIFMIGIHNVFTNNFNIGNVIDYVVIIIIEAIIWKLIITYFVCKNISEEITEHFNTMININLDFFVILQLCYICIKFNDWKSFILTMLPIVLYLFDEKHLEQYKYFFSIDKKE